ncbi:hypothetical protein QTP70_000905 [Hemibagrus guttatus]|uniref:Murine leukemia virus integrase C-terminal domain-containing protein n=1 Tax=Hemibagrus guttatus TaxID=175788 RepID=A0AAE0USD7_9TELE|nr:hypothetical protein QTP70_000905 [Hemibagrus guttatus]
MQCGFRPSRGTLDQLYTLHRVLEGSWEFAQTVHMCELGELELGVHLEKAFDRVPRGILWEVLWEYGVRGPLIRALYNRSRSLVHIASCKSDLFPVHVGPRQGCPLSPVLVNCVFMDRISRRSQKVEEFKYLGVLFTSEGRMDREIDRRIGAAAAVMRSMYRSVVVKKELSWKAKLLIYQSIYVPTLTYGHELWVMTERVRSWIQAAEMSFLRRVAGHSLRDRVRSSVTWEGLGVEPLLLHIKRGQLRWLGHLFRMPLGRLPGEAFRACPTGKSPRGRPRTRWRDYVFQLAWECLRVPPEELEEVAREREVTGSLCLSQASLGIKAGYTLDRVPTHRRGHTLTMDNLEVPINLQCMSLDRGRKLEYPEETTEAQGEHANSTHTETGIEPPTLEGLELFVKNLDSWVDENYLRVELSQFGTITSVKDTASCPSAEDVPSQTFFFLLVFAGTRSASLLIGGGDHRPHLPPSLPLGVFGPAGLRSSLGSTMLRWTSLGSDARRWMSLGSVARRWTSLGPPARRWTSLGASARLWTSFGTLWPYRHAHRSPHLPRLAPRSPHLPRHVPVTVKGATEGRTSEINEELRTVKPGDWVYVKVFKRRWNKPRRVGPLKVILATPIALKVKRKNAWFHLNHCCRAPEPIARQVLPPGWAGCCAPVLLLGKLMVLRETEDTWTNIRAKRDLQNFDKENGIFIDWRGIPLGVPSEHVVAVEEQES